MNKKAKRRLVVVGGIVVIAMLVIVAIAGGGQAASSLSIGDVLGGGYEGKKVQVSGSVVAGSITAEGPRPPSGSPRRTATPPRPSP